MSVRGKLKVITGDLIHKSFDITFREYKICTHYTERETTAQIHSTV